MKLYAVGVGTGNSEDVTVKAVNRISESDFLFVPVKEIGEESFAFEIIKPYVKPHTEVVELVFPMTHNRDILSKAWDENAKLIYKYLSSKKDSKASFVVIGDITLYSTYMYMDKNIKSMGIEVECVAGITSYIGAAAAIGQPLALLDEKVAVIPACKKTVERLESIIDEFETVIIMKPSQSSERIVSILKEKECSDKFRLVYKVGTAEQTIYKNIEDIENSIPYLSVLIIKRGGFDE